MINSLLTLLVLLLALGGSVFLHEFGHFIVARWMKIDIEEFGFGFPPRLRRLWRAPGSLQVGKHLFKIPANFDLPLERVDLEGRSVEIIARQEKDQLILTSIELAATADDQPAPTYPSLTPDNQGNLRLSGAARQVSPGTELTLNWIPLGGFVRPRGENDPTIPDGLAAAAPLKRLAVLFAGPLMNLLTAVVLFALIASQQGVPVAGIVTISEVLPASPALAAGLKPADRLISINGVSAINVKQTSAAIRAGVDTSITLVVERAGTQITLSATPLSSREAPLGVSLSAPLRPATPLEALVIGAQETSYQAVNTALLPVALIRKKISPQEARPIGLVGMFNLFGQAIVRDSETRQAATSASTTSGAAAPTNWVLSLAAMLAISLGVFNLYPIPALDGGRILFTLPELFLRRRIPYQMENIINGVAFLVLIGLMVVINSWDVIDPAKIILPK